MTRVLVVDDHPIVLAGLSALIESEDDLDLVGAATTCAQALAVEGDVDVAVVDLRLPDGDGIDLAIRLKGRHPALRVVVLTMLADDDAVMRALGSGVDGYLLKDCDPEDVITAVHAVTRGTLVLGPGAAAPVVAAAATAPRTDVLAGLDEREREILDLLVRGLPTSQVAARLFLAPKTVRNRLSIILGKLAVGSRDEALALGRAAGLGGPRR